MATEHFFLTVVHKDKDKLLDFCEKAEERFNTDILTGLNYAETKDGKFVLGLVFSDQEQAKRCYKITEEYDFDKVYTKEEDWISLIRLARISMLGNFSVKMVR